MNEVNKKRIRNTLIYYAILSLPLLVMKSESEPPMLYRIAYLAAVILPALFEKNIIFPALLTFFMTVSLYGYAYALMPYQTFIYPIIAFLPVVFYRSRGLRPNKWIWILFLYTLFIDFLTSWIYPHFNMPLLTNSFYCFLLVIFFYMRTPDNKKSSDQMELSFAMVSIFISLLFLGSGDKYIQVYDAAHSSGLERKGWIDPNYMGCIIGMGTSIAISQIMLFGEKKVWEKIVYYATILISLPVLALNASRGAILAVVVSFIVVVFYSRVRVFYKLVITMGAVALVLVLFNSGYFDLLLYRIENDQGGGSNRLDIWTSYWTAFWNGGVLSLLFGNGLVYGQNILGYGVGFHNDFLAFLVEYGMVGFVLFIFMFVYLFRNLSKDRRRRTQSVCAIMFLIVCCLTLEPLTSGVMPYFIFLYYIFLLSDIKTKTSF